MSGSKTAKGGFNYEHQLVGEFNNWKHSQSARKMLSAMDIVAGDIQSILAKKVKGSVKPDIEIEILFNNGKKRKIPISVKKYVPSADFNHVCRSSVEKYHTIFGFDKITFECLSVFTGEVTPSSHPELLKSGVTLSGKRKTFKDFEESLVAGVLDWFEKNLEKVITYSFCGEKQKPEFLIIGQDTGNGIHPHVYGMSDVVGYLSQKGVSISPRGSIKLGNGEMTFQRKGGTGSPTNLQFKFKPSEILRNL